MSNYSRSEWKQSKNVHIFLVIRDIKTIWVGAGLEELRKGSEGEVALYGGRGTEWRNRLCCERARCCQVYAGKVT